MLNKIVFKGDTITHQQSDKIRRSEREKQQEKFEKQSRETEREFGPS